MRGGGGVKKKKKKDKSVVRNSQTPEASQTLSRKMLNFKHSLRRRLLSAPSEKSAVN